MRSQSDEQATAHGDHRLRGEELAEDFDDAEGDSCVVIHRRVERESDS